MLKKKNTLFTIGQFAALHEINKKTLMWYDEIGLLKPNYVGKNGYRYYTYEQSPTLEAVLLLRELDVSLEEIQAFMKNRSAANFEILLDEKTVELEQTISHLKSVQKVLSDHKQDLSLLLHMDLSEIGIIDKKSQYLVSVNAAPDLSAEKEIALVVAEAKKYQLRRLHDASYGSMISVESLYRGHFSDYAALYIEMPYPVSKKGLHLRPAGKYLRAFCKGSWDKLPHRYEEILSYVKENRLSLCGFAYETGINELVIDTIDDYITQIEIPLKTE